MFWDVVSRKNGKYNLTSFLLFAENGKEFSP